MLYRHPLLWRASIYLGILPPAVIAWLSVIRAAALTIACSHTIMTAVVLFFFNAHKI